MSQPGKQPYLLDIAPLLAMPVSVLTIDTLRQVAAGKAQRLETGGPSREAENGRALARFFVPDWSGELRYRLLPSDKTVAA
jgi:hypothetical protein